MKIHFIGIGGIGISALARILKLQGNEITGSDMQKTALTDTLEKIGISVLQGHQAENLTEDVQKVIYTEAIPHDNPEYQKAQSLGLPMRTYFQALGDFAQDYKVVAIAGTHGKTTTTTMTGLSLIDGEMDPTVIVGTKVKEFANTNVRMGKSEILVVEACEYRESFLNLIPQILVITNMEAEHLDYYGTEEHYVEAFRKLCQKVPEDGFIIVLEGDENSEKVVRGVKANVVKLKVEGDRFWIHHGGQASQNGNSIVLPKLQVPGEHYKIDASFAMIVGILNGVSTVVSQKALEKFQGTWRRFERKGEKNGVIVIDDYAHHPTEIQATLKGAREMFAGQKIICVFQPHQYSRTRHLFHDFAKSFQDCNIVIIPNIYKVRDTEEDVKSVSAEELVEAIQKNGQKAIYGNGFENTVQWLEKNVQSGDVVITMGAGPVNEVGEIFLK